ncbi:hypothetical protein JYU34_000472 [Plutella xylostella]|uniref:Uncharacterized protein n=1 Tax=Plutella xylostella TaxID=51655 RepID=A0ABQ7R7T3_PLUXY|nr:hypothetical protein JYU34_000472 [Plutella xylostella]
MRGPSPRRGPLRPHGLLLVSAALVLASPALAAPQETTLRNHLNIVCIQPESQLCLTWPARLKNTRRIFESLSMSLDVDKNCGYSDLTPVSARSQYLITVTPLNSLLSTRNFHCKSIGTISVPDSEDDGSTRVRRQTGYPPRGKYRGQTQSQYLSIDRGAGGDDGKAEARSTADESHASVSGKSGMGQAQSQTIFDPSCDDCLGGGSLGAENLKRQPGAGYPAGSTYPGGGPGQSPDGIGGYGPGSRDGTYGRTPTGAGKHDQGGTGPYGQTPGIGMPGTYGQTPTGTADGGRGTDTYGQGGPGRYGQTGPGGYDRNGPTGAVGPTPGGPNMPGTYGQVPRGLMPGQATHGQLPGGSAPGYNGVSGPNNYGQTPGGTPGGSVGPTQDCLDGEIRIMLEGPVETVVTDTRLAVLGLANILIELGRADPEDPEPMVLMDTLAKQVVMEDMGRRLAPSFPVHQDTVRVQAILLVEMVRTGKPRVAQGIPAMARHQSVLFLEELGTAKMLDMVKHQGEHYQAKEELLEIYLEIIKYLEQMDTTEGLENMVKPQVL